MTARDRPTRRFWPCAHAPAPGWRRGERVPVETYLAQAARAAGRPRAVLDLIYNEILLREEAGESPQLEEYLSRFPELADAARAPVRVETAISSESSVD